jgi:Pyridoxal-dependent decarboxylase conserved domain
MEPNANQLMVENMAKNLADSDEYPALIQIHQRCISILSHLWGVQKGENAIGSATTGSSEAIHLGGLAMKRRWQEMRKAEGKDTSKPNIIMGANAQVALEVCPLCTVICSPSLHAKHENRNLHVTLRSRLESYPSVQSPNSALTPSS